jgi:hypothetical protein
MQEFSRWAQDRASILAVYAILFISIALLIVIELARG